MTRPVNNNTGMTRNTSAARLLPNDMARQALHIRKGGQMRKDMTGGTWGWTVQNDGDAGRSCGGGADGRTAGPAGGAIAGGRGTLVCGGDAWILT